MRKAIPYFSTLLVLLFLDTIWLSLTGAMYRHQIAAPLALGAGFGFFCFATYDLTNWAVLKDWTSSLTLMDIAWGACLSATASVAGYFASKKVLLF